MLGALLAGVRRALPYLGAGDAGDAAVGRHADALFRMLHVAPFGVRAQALALLAQLLAERGAMSDRFYRRAPLRGRTRPCLTAPSSSSAVGQQLGRQRDRCRGSLQGCDARRSGQHCSTPRFTRSAGGLVLVLGRAWGPGSGPRGCPRHPGPSRRRRVPPPMRGRARARRALYATLLAPELPGSTRAAMFLSLLFRALKADVSGRRVAAFLKRLLQVALAAPPNLACGCLLLTSEVLKARARGGARGRPRRCGRAAAGRGRRGARVPAAQAPRPGRPSPARLSEAAG